MTFRPILFACSFILSLSGTCEAQFLSSETAAADSAASFARRMPRNKPEMNPAIREAERIGWLIYRVEALGDLATTVLAPEATGDERASIAGWIVLPGNEWRVRFYKSADGSFAPVADVVFDNVGESRVEKDAQPFSEDELAMISATELAKADPIPCEDGIYKNVVIRTATGGFAAYVLRDSIEAGRIPVGQHKRLDISADGRSILSQQNLAQRCNVLSAKRNGNEDAEFKQSNTTDNHPSELHVYLSLRYKLNLFLATMPSNMYWRIQDGTVRVDE